MQTLRTRGQASLRDEQPLLNVEQLHVHITTPDGLVQPVRGVSFAVHRGETLAVVGESGCGKSMTALAVAGLLPDGAAIAAGSLALEGTPLHALPERDWRSVRGRRIGMVFQSPMSAFNPTMRIGEQIAESLVRHRGVSWQEGWQRAAQLLDRMRVPDAAARVRQYPFQFSGGMLQRAMIAMALACDPDLLIADEPTTALDVSVQVELLALLHELQQERGMGMLLITHDLAIVAQIADRVTVMYAGQLVEQAPVTTLFASPAHPYTQALLQALPERHAAGHRLAAIAGTPPDLLAPPVGCAFFDRCPQALQLCATAVVPEVTLADEQRALCWLRYPAVTATLAETDGTQETHGDV